MLFLNLHSFHGRRLHPADTQRCTTYRLAKWESRANICARYFTYLTSKFLSVVHKQCERLMETFVTLSPNPVQPVLRFITWGEADRAWRRLLTSLPLPGWGWVELYLSSPCNMPSWRGQVQLRPSNTLSEKENQLAHFCIPSWPF